MLGYLLVPIFWLAALDSAAITLGWPLARRLMPDDEPLIFHALMALVLGWVWLAFAVFALGALQALYTPVLITLIGGLCGYGLYGLTRARRRFGELPFPALDGFLLLCLTYLLLFLPRCFDFYDHHDAFVYHFTIPQYYLQHHGLVPYESFLFFNMPHWVDLLYCFPMSLGGMAGVKLFSWQFNFVTLAGIALTARRLNASMLIGTLSVLYISSHLVQFHFVSSYVDAILGCFLLYAHLLFLLWRQTRRYPALLGCCLCAGFLMGCKYTTWFFLIGLFGFVLFDCVQKLRHKALKGRQAFILLGVWVLPPGVWLIKNALFMGNPVYPMLHSVFGGEWWSTIQELQLGRIYGRSDIWPNPGFPWSIADFAQQTWYWIKEDLYKRGEISLALAGLFALTPFFPRTYRNGYRFFFLCALTALLLWRFSPSLQIRFLTMLLPLAVIACAPVLLTLRRIKVFWTATLFFILACLIIYAKHPAMHWRMFTPEYFATNRDNFYWNLIWDEFNPHLDANSKIMMMFDNIVLYSSYPIVPDSLYEAPSSMRLLWDTQSARKPDGDVEAFSRRLAGEGITHVIYNKEKADMFYFENDALLDSYLMTRERRHKQRELVHRFFLEQCRLLYKNEIFQLYKINPKVQTAIDERGLAEAHRFHARGLDVMWPEGARMKQLKLNIDWDDSFELQLYRDEKIIHESVLHSQPHDTHHAPRLDTPAWRVVNFPEVVHFQEVTRLRLTPKRGDGVYTLHGLEIIE